jgi:hypothetical protein
MATGRLGTAAPAATTLTTVYTVPTGNYAVCSISCTNRHTSSAKIRIAMSTSDTPNPEDYIEYDTSLIGYGVFERTGLVLQAGLKLIAYSDTAFISVNIYGIETSTA